MSYSTILYILTWLSAAKLAKVIQIIKEIEELFSAPGSPAELQPLYSPTPYELHLESLLTQQMSTDATQAAIDWSEWRNRLLKWGPTIIAIIRLFGVPIPNIPLPAPSAPVPVPAPVPPWIPLPGGLT